MQSSSVDMTPPRKRTPYPAVLHLETALLPQSNGILSNRTNSITSETLSFYCILVDTQNFGNPIISSLFECAHSKTPFANGSRTIQRGPCWAPSFSPSHLHHALQAFSANDVHRLGCPDALSAARANILPRTTRPVCPAESSGAVPGLTSRSSWRHPSDSSTLHGDFTPPMLNHILQEFIRRAGHRPSIFRVLLDVQPAAFRFYLKSGVMIASTSTAILDAMRHVLQVGHFM